MSWAEYSGRAKEFYTQITASTVLGMLLNFGGVNPIKALFWTAVIHGFLKTLT